MVRSAQWMVHGGLNLFVASSPRAFSRCVAWWVFTRNASCVAGALHWWKVPSSPGWGCVRMLCCPSSTVLRPPRSDATATGRCLLV